MTFILLAAGTLLNIWFSRRSLTSPRVHGFYRFFVFEAILILVLMNAGVWFLDPWSVRQFVSWALLWISLLLAIHGFFLLRVVGRPKGDFEQTTQLVVTGAYRYIRHPLYASLLAFGWGAFLKDISLLSAAVVILLTVFATLTAVAEERENIERFGKEYEDYVKGTRRFIPFLF